MMQKITADTKRPHYYNTDDGRWYNYYEGELLTMHIYTVEGRECIKMKNYKGDFRFYDCAELLKGNIVYRQIDEPTYIIPGVTTEPMTIANLIAKKMLVSNEDDS